jgi:very-short-patch-repair endonuclease
MTENSRGWIPSHRPLNQSEKRLIALLQSMHLAVIPQATDGHWTLDAYLPPPINAAIEVDGPAYHTKPEDSARDRAREAALRAAGLVVIRAWSPDLRTGVGVQKVRRHILTRLLRDRGIKLQVRGAEKLYRSLAERAAR